MLAVVVDVAHGALDGGGAVARGQQARVAGVAAQLHDAERPRVAEARGLEGVAEAAVGGRVVGAAARGRARRGECGEACAAFGGFGAAARGAEVVEEGFGGLEGLGFLLGVRGV